MFCAVQKTFYPSQSTQSQSQSTTDFICGECGARLLRKHDLGRHMLTHSENIEEFKYPCPFEGCKTACLQKGNLVTHMKRHNRVKDKKCPHDGCTWTTGDPAALTRHRKAKHGYMPASRAPRTRPAKGEKKVSQTKPYTRVAPAAEFKQSFKAQGGIILPNFVIAGMASSSSTLSAPTSSTSSSSSISTTLSPVPTATSSTSSDTQTGLKLDSQQSSCDATMQEFFKLYPASDDVTSLISFTTNLDAPFLPGPSSTSASGSGVSDTEFSDLLTTFGMDTFTASLQEPISPIPASTSLLNFDSSSSSIESSNLTSLDAWQAPENDWTRFISAPSPTDSVFSRPFTPESDVPSFETPFSALDIYAVESPPDMTLRIL